MSEERLLAFCRLLADSLRSSLPLVEALRSPVAVAAGGRGMLAAAQAVADGSALHEAVAAHASLPPALSALLRAGEESGKLDAFLDRYAETLEASIDFRRRLARVLLYPLTALSLAAVIFVLLTLKAMPLLLEPMADAGASPPESYLRVHAWLMEASARWPSLLLGTAAAAALSAALAGSWPGRRLRALAGWFVPGWAWLVSEARAARFESTWGLLLGAGLRPRQAAELLAAEFREDPVLSSRLSRAAGALSEGASWSESVGACLPAEDRARVETAEKAGRLDATLVRLAAEHRERHLHRLKTATTMIRLGSVAALAPLCFGLVMWLLQPALGMLGGLLGVASPQAPLPALSAPAQTPAWQKASDSAAKERSEAASRFNEAHAPGILGAMGEGVPDAAPAGPAPAGPSTAAAAGPKPVPRPHLKERSFSGGVRRRSVQPTEIRSGLP